jgi:hypothetical protein
MRSMQQVGHKGCCTEAPLSLSWADFAARCFLSYETNNPVTPCNEINIYVFAYLQSEDWVVAGSSGHCHHRGRGQQLHSRLGRRGACPRQRGQLCRCKRALQPCMGLLGQYRMVEQGRLQRRAVRWI